MIRLSVPGTLRYRDVVLRVIASSCSLVRSMALGKQEPSRESHEFDDKVVSAVSEAFNNVAIHAYRELPSGAVELEIETSPDSITIHMADTGRVFEPAVEALRAPETLPESHMGLYIMRSCMDQVTYRPGNASVRRNVLTLSKRFIRGG